MTRARTLRIAVFAGRWLWLAVLLAVLAMGAYLLARLSQFDDQAALAARVAELRGFQERMTQAAIVESLGFSAPGATHVIVAEAEQHAAEYLGDLERLGDGGTASAAIDDYLASMRELASLGDTLSSGEVTLTEIAFTYTTISGRANRQIDVALQSLSEEGQMTAAEVRWLAYLGLALLGGGGVVSATGYGWTGRRTRVLTRDIEETRELDALKSEFVALASHELRTPLTGIYGFSRLLMDDDEVSIEEWREWAGYIHSEAAHLTTIVENLLNVSRIESGTLDLRTEPVDVNEVIDTVLRSFDGGSELHSFEIAGDLERVVLGDRNKLVEVLGNMVDNAVKYSPRGGVVRIEGAAGRELLSVSVTDEGVGIPPDELPTVFERFKRVSNPETEHVRSTGLGLYLARELVRQMGGTIHVSSVSGEGSTFTFTIPLERAGAPPLDPAIERKAAA